MPKKPKLPNPPKTPFQSNSVWLFRNIHTNQVLFSPHRVIRAKSALQQFPSPKRRLFPLSIRKDYWIPLVHVQFPTHLIANHVYKRLLDFRAWRLTSPLNPKDLLKSKKQRDQESLNQVPTAIADLAHVTQPIEGKMIMNWHRREEKDWAKEWSENIWHCSSGFVLSRGYKLDKYEFPNIPHYVRKQNRWDGSLEPPRDYKSAIERHKSIWEKMHAKFIRKAMIPLKDKEPRNLNTRWRRREMMAQAAEV